MMYYFPCNLILLEITAWFLSRLIQKNFGLITKSAIGKTAKYFAELTERV